MANSATDIISLADAKDQLRIDGDDQDELVLAAIDGAVSWVSSYLRMPLVDRTQTFDLPESLVTGDRPATVKSPFVRSVSSIAYWLPTQELREDAGGSVDAATLGRIEPNRSIFYRSDIYPPAAGWPDMLRGSKVIITATVGRDIADHETGITHAVILAIRQHYEQPEWSQQSAAMLALLAQYRDLRQ